MYIIIMLQGKLCFRGHKLLTDNTLQNYYIVFKNIMTCDYNAFNITFIFSLPNFITSCYPHMLPAHALQATTPLRKAAFSCQNI